MRYFERHFCKCFSIIAFAIVNGRACILNSHHVIWRALMERYLNFKHACASFTITDIIKTEEVDNFFNLLCLHPLLF